MHYLMKQQILIGEKVVVILLAVLVSCGMLTGCSKKTEVPSDSTSMTKRIFDESLKSENNSKVEQSESIPSEIDEEMDFPGSYTVPDGWVRAEQYSTKNKIFYVEEGHEEEEMPDNISIEIGTNRYSLEEHEQFRNAIVRQLSMQISGSDAQVTGSGSITAQDYILYIFTISEEEIVTKQYYIVDDKRYCLIHLTNFTGSERVDDAAKALADSFVWNDLENESLEE